MRHMKTIHMKLILLSGAFALGACHELPQDVKKPFAAKYDTQLYVGSRFDGDKARFEKALAARAQGENEYVRMGDVPKDPLHAK
jgi:starvation-inducible outer membrane lipoprotein